MDIGVFAAINKKKNQNMNKNELNKIRNLIAHGELEAALVAMRLMAKNLNDKNLLDSFLVLSSRYSNLKKKQLSGISSKEETMSEENRLSSATISLLKELELKSTGESVKTRQEFKLSSLIKDRIILKYFVTILVIGLSTIIFLNLIKERIYESKLFGIGEIPYLSIVFWMIGVFIIAIFYRILLNYLETQDNKERKKITAENLTYSIKDLKAEDIAKNLNIFNKEEKNELLKIIENKLSDEVIDEFKKKAETELKRESRYEHLTEDFLKIEERILDEIKSLNRKANVNLAIGVITTFLAVIFLVYVSLNLTSEFTGWLSFVSYYVPRLALVIFIEVFSFYFLKLYRTNLNEIQYYQNELTDINFKVISLKTALLSEDEDNIKHLINELVKSDHNKILKKDETTAELERYKAESQNSKEILDQIFNYYNFKGIFNNDKMNTAANN